MKFCRPGRRFDRENARYCKPGRRFDRENARFCGPGRRFDRENTWFCGAADCSVVGTCFASAMAFLVVVLAFFAGMAASQALPVMFRGLWRALGRPALVVRASNRTWKQEVAPPGLHWQSCKNCTWWKEGPLIHSVVSSACLESFTEIDVGWT